MMSDPTRSALPPAEETPTVVDVASGVALAGELIDTAMFIARNHVVHEPHFSRLQRAIRWLRGERDTATVDLRRLVMIDPLCGAISAYGYQQGFEAARDRFNSELSTAHADRERLERENVELKAKLSPRLIIGGDLGTRP